VVRDDAYLQSFARACRAMDWPIFIRFAGEMNGEWTPYHGDPQLYREKFRLVHHVLHRHAPRIATIWCVNAVPSANIQEYYPGDDGCDWVGVNAYSVPYYDDDRSRPAFLDNILALIEPVYRLYARKKPIAICEYAASHMAAVDRVRRNDFAIDQMLALYGALPRLYPRIKMINWFNMDNLRHARPGRQLNNYNLTEQPSVLENYRRIVSAAYFLGAPERLSNPRPQVPRPLAANQRLHGTRRFSIWVKTYVPRPQVYFAVASKIVYASARPGIHSIDLDLNQVPPGRRRLTVYVYDNRGRFVTSMTRTIIVRHWQ
ncbi:MAG TPA: glycosyl hydrolase, partial [Abditibacteriaceae bacterium]|nr:glycosyl hydrolase [Abditibacteriaceae bacterium]